MIFALFVSSPTKAGLLQCEQIDLIDRQLEVAQAHFTDEFLRQRREAALRQTTLQRHLTAFETDFVEAARTRFLTLVTTASRLAEARTDATADATLGVLAPAAGFRLFNSISTP